MKINLWLDDHRPAPDGWTHVQTVHEAIRLIKSGQVAKASLDHDLGLCSACTEGGNGQSRSRNCECVSGYKLCLWMAENNRWPDEKPVVHSQNPVGALAMRQVIDRYFPKPNPVISSVEFDALGNMHIKFQQTQKGGCIYYDIIQVPVFDFTKLAFAWKHCKQKLTNYEIIGNNEGIRWPELDEDISVNLLMNTYVQYWRMK